MLITQRPALTEESVNEYRSRFVIEPLEPGFGYTLGNSLRRTLLSSIPGAAVTSIKIDGVLHEFTTVPGVKEDVTELILNIKQLVISSENDEPVTMYLRKQGPGTVTAADIAPPAGVTSGFGATAGTPPGHTACRTPPSGPRKRSSVPPSLAITASKRYRSLPGSSWASTNTGAT